MRTEFTMRNYSLRTLVLLFLTPFMLLIIISYVFFYYLGSGQISRQTHENAANIVRQIKQGLERELENAYTAASSQLRTLEFFSLRKSVETEEGFISPSMYVNLHTDLKEFVRNSDSIRSMVIYLDDGSIFAQYSPEMPIALPMEFRYEDYAEKVSNQDLTWISSSDTASVQFRRGRPSELGMMSLLGTEASARHGFILFEFKDEVFGQAVERALITPGSEFFVVKNGELLNAGERALLSETEQKCIEEKLSAGQKKEFYFQSENYYYFYTTLDFTKDADVKMGVLAAVPIEEMLLNQRPLFWALVVIIILFSLMCVFVFAVVSRVVSNPVVRLERKLRQVSEEHLYVDVEVSGSREIVTISRAVSELLERIRILIRHLDQEMDNRRIAELNILHAQINPHFLYNTLDTIYQLCTIGEIHEAQNITNALATFYRIGVSKGGAYISLKEEFNHTRMYLSILRTRFDDFDYEISLPKELEHYRTLKTIVQPLVENSIYHGIRPLREGGMIRITAYEDGGDIVIVISDNGIGMTEDKLREVRDSLLNGNQQQNPGRVYGVANVHSRIRLTYKGEYGISIDSAAEEGCQVAVRIPKEENPAEP